MGWVLFIIGVLGVSSLVGLHLGRFRETYTEMTGMMAGMTMGMLNGFLLGYGAAAATQTQGLFWGNLFGILLGLSLGVYFGRAGGLMGIMDGAMGGMMGGSMGAMLAVMLVFPPWTLFWTAVLLSVVYLVGTGALVILIERRDPEHAALHRLMPSFMRAVAEEAAEEAAEGAGRADTALEESEHCRQLRLRKEEKARALQATVPASLPEKAQVVAVAQVQARPTASQTARASVTAAPRSKPRTRPVQASRRSERREAPISWVGVAGLITIIVVVGAWWLTGLAAGQSGVSGTTNPPGAASTNLSPDLVSRLDAQAVSAPVGSDGRQTLDVAVNGNTRGYEPSVIKVKQGAPVHFNLSVKGSDPGCGRFVGVRGLGVHGIATPGQVTSMDFTPNQTGVFQINCNMQMMVPGYLIVTQ